MCPNLLPVDVINIITKNIFWREMSWFHPTGYLGSNLEAETETETTEECCFL